jgi:ribokinase
VVGHVEWVEFMRVDHYPARGEVAHAERAFTHASGGAVVAAAVLAQLGAEVDFYCALGRDDNGHAALAELQDRDVTVHSAWRQAATRSVFTLLEDDGERTIFTIGERLAPSGDDDLDWGRLARADGVYVTAGDRGAVRRARAARVLTASPRARDALEDEDLAVDALVFSASDSHEREWASRVEDRTKLMVATEGGDGGHWWGESSGRWPAVALPGQRRDAYGCGDAFAAGFTFGLAQGLSVLEAADIGARCGARMLTVTGAP